MFFDIINIQQNKARESMNKFLPLTSRLRRRVFKRPRTKDMAAEIVEIAPSYVRHPEPAISLPNEIERVERFEPTNSPQVHFDRLYAREQHHGPTVAYRFDQSLIYRGSLYFGDEHRNFTKSPKRFFLSGEPISLVEAQVSSSPLEHVYFGHWLHDTLPLELLAYDRGLPAVRPPDPPWMHTSGYRSALGMMPNFVEHARISKLWLIDDRGLNKNWGDRYLRVRNSLKSCGYKKSGNEFVFISRGKSGAKREIINLNEVESILKDIGFLILYPEQETSETIAKTLASSRIVVGMVGSALAHAQLAMPEGAALVTIQPSTLFSGFHKLFADVSGIRFAFVVADRQGDDSIVDISRLLKTLDLVQT